MKNRKKVVLILMYCFVVSIWLFGFMPKIGFDSYLTKYPIPLTMIPGGFVSGFTICGGGAVSFPVFCKVLKLDAMMARDFALGIQSFGMTCAAITILIRKIKIEKRVAIFCTIGSIIGIFFGNVYIVPIMSSENMKILFSMVIAAFGVSLFLNTFCFKERRKYICETISDFQMKTVGALLIIGFVGGVFTSVLGTGADIIAFSIVTILFRVDEKVLNPTSDIIMAVSSVAGLLMRMYVFGGIHKDAAASFPLAIPIVIIMAPLGAIMASKLKRLSVVKFLLFFIVIEIGSTFYSLQLGNSQKIIVGSLFAGLLLFYFILFKFSEIYYRRNIMENIRYYTSESVMAGHPDKMSDAISDSILDAVLTQDPNGHVACETLVSENLVVVSGEILTQAEIDYEKIIRSTINRIGYDSDQYGFNGNTCRVMVELKQQSEDIVRGVNKGEEIGAGDQGMMFGYACDETEEYMPMSLVLAHNLVRRMDEYRREIPDMLGPDGKAQVTVAYRNGKIESIDTIVVSIQHAESIELLDLKQMLSEQIISKVIPEELIDKNTKIYINPTGRFVEGGPKADTGLTGRKIIVDTYGGYAAHGGGAFSGKDPTKVDRTGAYMARYIAKNIVAAGLAKKCQIALSYAIGIEQPISLEIECFGTETISENKLIKLIYQEFDLSPRGMIRQLDLRRPIYAGTSAYGHFGRTDNSFSWEQLDRVDDLKC